MNEDTTVCRIDKWLWAVRIFKTRSQATEACKNGKIKFNEQAVKASHTVAVDEVYVVSLGPLKKTIKVKAILHNRVAAKMANDFMEDLTPQEVYQKIQDNKKTSFYIREKGSGRPTKKERRQIDKLDIW